MLPELIYGHVLPDTVRRVAQRLGSTNASVITQGGDFLHEKYHAKISRVSCRKDAQEKRSEVMTEPKVIRCCGSSI